MLYSKLRELNLEWVTEDYEYSNPSPVGATDAEVMLVKHLKANDKIAIFPDSDIDGFFSALIIYNLLSFVGCNDIEVIRVEHKTHGLTTEICQQVRDMGAKLLITVDSSTNSEQRVGYLDSFDIDHIIIDHHVITADLSEYPKSVKVVNCKQEGNEFFNKVSAGMLCYIFAEDFLNKINISEDMQDAKIAFLNTLFVLGYITLYTDSMDLADEFNLSVIRRAGYMYQYLPPFIRCFMGPYDGLNRNFIEYRLGPKLNAVIRLEQFDLIYNLLFNKLNQDDMAKTITHINEIYEKSRAFVNLAVNQRNPDVHEGFVSLNLDDLGIQTDISPYMKNFTGLVANQLTSVYDTLAFVYCTDDMNNFKGSVRDPYSRQALTHFQSFCDCGGHMSAFGLHIPKATFNNFLSQTKVCMKAIPETAETARIIIHEDDIDESINSQLRLFARYNEVSGNTIPKAVIRVKLGHMSKVKKFKSYYRFEWRGVKVTSFNPVNIGTVVEITPTISRSGVQCIGTPVYKNIM